MALADELCDRAHEITQRWYEAWRDSRHPHPELKEIPLKDMLPQQLQRIGKEIKQLNSSESPEDLWLKAERLDPEARVLQKIPIEEVVQEFRIAVEVVQKWINEHHIDVSFREYSYFYSAMFELVAESVRRYSRFQAEQVSRERSLYLAGISHQMRNPLTAMNLQIELLSKTQSPDVRAGVLTKLRDSTKRLLLLVNGVLRLERFKPEEIPVRAQVIQAASVVDYVLNENEPEAARKGLRLEVAFNHALQLTVDPDLLVDALGNLLQNAVKYTDSGFVRLEVVEEEGGTVLFKVRDSGPGISTEKQKSLFGKLKPGERGGVGIGLAIAQSAVRAQGGKIGFQSKPGKGALFWIRLPKNVPERQNFHEKKTA